jgi:ribosomal protein L7/L12
MSFCSNCGARVPDDATNCTACGAPVSAASTNEQEGPRALSIDPGMTAQVQQYAREGKKIQAIKEYREQTGAGLKEAKDAVERWMQAEGIVAASGSGCGTSVLILMTFLGGGLFLVL